jgi:hypothetical protein
MSINLDPMIFGSSLGYCAGGPARDLIPGQGNADAFSPSDAEVVVRNLSGRRCGSRRQIDGWQRLEGEADVMLAVH